MKILLYTLNYAPELIGVGKYNTEMSEWLDVNGHDVRVIAANPYYPEWEIKKGYHRLAYRKEIINNISIDRCPLYVKKNISFIQRLVHLISFAVSSFPILLIEVGRQRPDVVILIEPPLVCAPGALMICKTFKIKSWLHIQDFEIDAAFDTKLLSFPILKRLLISIEKLITNQFEVVSSISAKMVDRLVGKGVTRPQIHKIVNWADTAEFTPALPSESLKKELGVRAGDTIVLYSGNLGHKQGIDLILEAAKVLLSRGQRHIRFILCGDGAMRNKIERQSSKMENVQLLPIQPIDRYKQLLNTTDLHLIPQRSDINDNAMPSKISTILASGGVIIAMANPDTEVEKVVKESGGIVCMPGDVGHLAESISHLSNGGKGLLKQMKQKAREYALEYYDKDRILSSLNNVLRSI